jgi:hypothetical protein
VIYSHESPDAAEIITDFDWDLDRFVAYRSPLTRKEILPKDRIRVGTEIVIDLK